MSEDVAATPHQPTRWRLPSRGRPLPTATYRLQLRSGFGFVEVAELADYLAALGVSHAYLSPVLQAVPGSSHGYDVIDHSRLSEELGGAQAYDGMAGRLDSLGLGVVVDVVPNHMAVPTPASLNVVLWSVLRDGPASLYADWFDVDWAAQQSALLLPVLGQRIGDCLDAGEITVDRDGPEPVVRYHEHVFPVRPGTADLPLPQLLDEQFYRLAYWRVGDEELNYRRFFDVDTLAAVRVENPAVFAESHALLLALVNEGKLDGLRVDHPDGLADPRTYLERLAGATRGSWVVVEKILQDDEELPEDWDCAGTTGYDALRRVGGLFVDPAGAAPLRALHQRLTGLPDDLAVVEEDAKRLVATTSLSAEISRLVELAAAVCADDVRLRDHTRAGVRTALEELIVALPVYRAYVVPGEQPPPASVELLERAAAVARERAPERAAEVDLVLALALGRLGRDRRRDEFVVRFQQTCGPVMAKGVEDTAFYRWAPLAALNEVGGDPAGFGVSPEDFHRACEQQAAGWPGTMTTLSTHDTKRSEDVRARLAVLSEVPEAWAEAVGRWHQLSASLRPEPGGPDGVTENLLWQTLVGAWPVSAERLAPYLTKAMREARLVTSWQQPDEDVEKAAAGFATAVLEHPGLVSSLEELVASIALAAAVNTLGQKLVQLGMPGVPDVYQGNELHDLSLVDPDNRRPVDYGRRRELLSALDDGAPVGDLETADGLDRAKLLVTSRLLRLRRDRPHWFGPDSGYRALALDGDRAGHGVAFARGEAVLLATRLPVGLARAGGWGDARLHLPDGDWTELLTNRPVHGGTVRVADLLASLPVAVLVPRSHDQEG